MLEISFLQTSENNISIESLSKKVIIILIARRKYMARVSENSIHSYKAIDAKELQSPMIFVVDMINGFIKEGALHDEAIMRCVKPIEALLQHLTYRSVFIADRHPSQTREFNSYPTHCLIGTSESEVIEELQPYIKELFHKNSTNTFTCPQFQEFLKEIELYDTFIITGCCTDICILQFALCFNAWLNEHNMMKKRIIIPIDCVDTYHIDGIHDAITNNEFSLQNMSANGIEIVTHIECEE